MQPLHVEPLDLDAPDTDRFDSNNTANEEVYNSNQVNKAIVSLKLGIFKFKQNLFEQIINQDTGHDASDLGAMMTYHSLFLQCVSYWISLLDSGLVPMPRFASDRNSTEFEALKTAIQKVARSSPDARIQLYQLLFRFGQQHPFDLGQREKEE